MSLALAVVMCVSLCVPAFAADISKSNVVAVLVVNGQPFGLSQEDLRMVQSNELAQIAYYESLSAPATIEPDTLNIVQPLYIRTVKYQGSSGNTYLVYSKEYAVTGLLQGEQDGGSISYGQSQTVSETLTANISLSASYKDTIVANIGSVIYEICGEQL